MAEVASAYVSLMFTARGAQSQIESEVTGPATKAGSNAGAKAGQGFGSKFTSALKSPMGKLGGLMAGYFAADKVKEFLSSSIKQASDLNETVNKSQVIFGAQAGSMNKWANNAATSFGLTKQQALESAASFGDMFRQIGFTGQAAAKNSKSVVQLATDLGSFNNLDTGEVLDMLSGAFRGEYDSLQRVIPNISAARVQQQAMAMTGKKNASALTAQEKAAATLAIVQHDGARAAGDFARTSGGLANSQKILKAQVGSLQADIGAALVPKLAKAATAAAKFIGQMRSGKGAGGAFASVLKVIGTALSGTIGFLMKHWKLVTTIVAAYAAWRTISAIITAVKVAQMAYTAITYGAAGATYATGTALKIYTAAMNSQAIAARLSAAATTVWSVATKAAAVTTRVLGIALRFMMGPWGLLIAAIAIGVVLIIKHWDSIKKAGLAVWGWLKSFIASAGAFLKNIFLNFTPVGQIIKHWNDIKAAASAVWGAIKSAISRVGSFLKSLFLNFTPVGQIIKNWNRIKGAASSVWNAIKSATSRAWSAVHSAVSGAVGRVVSVVRGLPGRAASAISSLGSRLLGVVRGINLFSAGAKLISGLASGIASKIEGVIDKVRSGVAKIKGLLPGSPIKWGPLKSWNNGGAGKRLMDVLASGIDAGAAAPVAAMASAAGAIADTSIATPGVDGGVIPYTAASSLVAASSGAATAGTVGALTITNWADGTGYFEILADGRVQAAGDLQAMVGRSL